MNTERFKIFAAETERKALFNIIAGCAEVCEYTELTVSVYAGSYEDLKDNSDDIADVYVVRYEDKALVDTGAKVVGYAEEVFEDSVSALNPQLREHSFSFEILASDFMGRVYLPKDSEFTRQQILIAFAALRAAGGKDEDVLKAINEFVKKRTDEK